MGNRLCSSAAPLAVAVVLLLPTTLLGQPASSDGKASNVPRTADGKPDMQGHWIKGAGIGGGNIDAAFRLTGLGTLTPVNLFREGEPPPIQPGGGGRSAIIDPPDGILPYQPWAAARRKEIAERHETNPTADTLDPQVRCALAGVPRINYQAENPFQILQAPTYVLMLHEWTHAYRFIPTDGRPSLPAAIKLWMGDSRARWEGDTLVVDVSNNNDKPYFDTVGSFHSDAMRVSERWTMVDADRIDYEVTIDDPKVFTRPWKMRMDINRIKETGYELIEHACHEGERDWNHILTGAAANENRPK
jgi:hypothetical protein